MRHTDLSHLFVPADEIILYQREVRPEEYLIFC